MKWFIASDIHGSAYWCRKMIDAFKEEKADRILLLGDLLYHGPRNQLPLDYSPSEVAKMLNEYKNVICAVRGNCDSEVDQMMLEFPMLADYIIICDKDTEMFASHGHIFNEHNLPPLKKHTVLLNGHTHVCKYVEHDEYIYVNPGSVSIPKEETSCGYCIFCDGKFECKSL